MISDEISTFQGVPGCVSCVTKHDLTGLVEGGRRDESLPEKQGRCIIWWTDLDAVFANGGVISGL